MHIKDDKDKHYHFAFSGQLFYNQSHLILNNFQLLKDL